MPRSARPRLLSLLCLAACADLPADDTGSDTSDTGAVDEPAAVTYHRDIAPLLAAKCRGCHSPGNIAPFALTGFAEAAQWAPALAAAAEAGTMPPWPPDAACNEYRHDRSLTADERNLLSRWSELGAPEGDPADAPPPLEPAPEIDYDLQLALPVAYTPTVAPDEYRCFVLDWPEEQTRFVTGFEVRPGEPSIVHHVIAFLVPPGKVGEYDALDAADPAPGYPCFGGPGGTRPGWLGAWAPGSSSGALPAGTGLRVEPGSKIVVQMHYHAMPGAPADRSTLAVRTADAVEREAYVVPFTNPAWISGATPMTIPAGAAAVRHSFTLDLAEALPLLAPGSALASGQTVELHAAGLHMHTLGVSGRISIAGAGGDTCALAIPRWDFGWQGSYMLARPITVVAGDELTLACEWDNSAAHQPLVDGVRQPPRDVAWGEGTGDEMCLGILYLTAT